MIIQSDWHIHSENSYDATLSLDVIADKAKEFGFKRIGITDHVNFNDKSFLNDLKNSSEAVKKFQKTHPEVVLGVELTPIEKPEFDYIAKTCTREGYVPPVMSEPYEIELAQTKEELMSYGVRYAIGAAHWRVDVPNARALEPDKDVMIKEWFRQQMWLACDKRVTVLGHPWWNYTAVWYDDFSVIPRSMNSELAAALKENKKYVECNAGLMCNEELSEKFLVQYTEFIRELFEMGIPITFGSDSHREYGQRHIKMEKILASAGFKAGDFSEIAEEDLW